MKWWAVLVHEPLHHAHTLWPQGIRSVLFVCLGNICRSPLAQGVFAHLVQQSRITQPFRIESCGTGHWHIGDPPDKRSIAVARSHGIALTSLGRQLDPLRDGAEFGLILAMDRANLADLLRAGCPESKCRLFLSFASEQDFAFSDPYPFGTLEVPDPYTAGCDEFERVYRLVLAGSKGLLRALTGESTHSHE